MSLRWGQGAEDGLGENRTENPLYYEDGLESSLLHHTLKKYDNPG